MKLKTMIRSALVVTGLLLALLALNGCLFDPDPTIETNFSVMASPSSVHPDAEVAVVAEKKDGGTYTFEPTGQATVQSAENVFRTIVGEYPWKCVVTWTDGISVATATVHITLENEGPIINQPRLSAGWQGIPGYRTFIDYRYCADEDTGIRDPEGDDWTMTRLVVQCDRNSEPDTLFYPSIYGIKEYHVDMGSGCDTIDVYPSAIWYPSYVAEIDGITGLPFSISTDDGGKKGYPVKEHYTLPIRRAQMATITISAQDEYGASTTRTFTIPIRAYEG